MNSRHLLRLPILILLTLVLAIAANAAPPLNRVPTVGHKGASWFFSDADGKPLVSIGVTTATFQGQSIRNTKVFPYGDACRKKHSTEEAWRKATAERLLAWGFNTAGPWSDAKLAAEETGGRRMLWTQDLDFGSSFAEKGGDVFMAWVHGGPPDLFDPAFEAHCRERAKERCAPHRDDPQLLGYFVDNELR